MPRLTLPTRRTAAVATPRREIAQIAVPVSAEFVLMLVLNFVNQVVVGTLGATAIAAVGFANSLSFILIITLGCLGTSVSILVARAFGAGRRVDMDHTVTAALVVAGTLGVLASLLPSVWAGDLLTATGASPTVAAVGTDYFRLVALATLPTMLSAILSGVLRSVGRATSPMVATTVTVLANSVLAYTLVTGAGPAPALGAAGAGWATLVTTTVKAAILVSMAFGRRGVVSWRLPVDRIEWRRVVVPLFVLALPLGVTELFWTGGTFLYNVVFQRLGDEALAAAQIVTTLEGVFIVGSIGLMSATTTLVGRAVGRGDAAGAVAWVHRLTRAGLGTGALFGVLFGASILLLEPLFQDAGPEVRSMAMAGIAVNAAFQVVKVRNMILGAGVLPSGNDVRGVIMGDAIGAFVVGLPIAVLLGLHTPLGVLGVFVARVVEEVAKLGVFTWRARRLRWHELARSGHADDSVAVPAEGVAPAPPADAPVGV
ncbi:putative efflux protein, MATE family [Pedococcus cremeus]|uniref:Probable multidrug resistance protein NorM n=1 Tax=Pedococcus cremeus TaxID=587636 RepID=A0A1H9VH13_9MICO|nr:MATE family efflux transporter [Pedococcus cremeus]SES20942.1 putative efflux protein, MATE family [Pedococcus cremeus]